MFLDRDGVINRMVLREDGPAPPADEHELEIIPGVADALRRLKNAGLILIVVTNQPDVARGKQSRAMVEQINARLGAALPLDDVRVCYHDDADGCDCRKPKPGLLVQAAHDFDLSLRESYIVGDRWRDVEAGRQAGCSQVLVESQVEDYEGIPPDVRVKSMVEAADWILARETRREYGRS